MDLYVTLDKTILITSKASVYGGVLKERSILQVFEYLCEDFGNMDSAESAPFMVICIIHGVICFPRR